MVHGIAKQILRVLALALLWMPIQSKASEGLRNNDDLSDAMAIVGEMGTLRTSNRGATAVEGEEELHRSNKTLWYKWTAQTNGIMTIDTLGSGFDTILAAYTGEDGASISGLSQLVFNDTGPGFDFSESQISFAATEGTTYYVSPSAPVVRTLTPSAQKRKVAFLKVRRMLPPALGGLRVSRAADPGAPCAREYEKDQHRAVSRKMVKLYYIRPFAVKSQN